MPYRKTDVVFEQSPRYDRKMIINLQLACQDALGQDLLGYNFNFYLGQGRPDCITVRYCIDTLEYEDEIVNSLRDVERDFSIKVQDPTDWDEPAWVKRAHELGSELALFLLKSDDVCNLLDQAEEDHHEITLSNAFLMSVLQNVGIDVEIPWAKLRPWSEQPEDFDIIRKRADGFVGQDWSYPLEDVDVDFLERFVHAYHNCTWDFSDEQIFYSNTMMGSVIDGWIPDS